MAGVPGHIDVRILAQYGDIEPTEIGVVEVPVRYEDGEFIIGSLEESLTGT